MRPDAWAVRLQRSSLGKTEGRTREPLAKNRLRSAYPSYAGFFKPILQFRSGGRVASQKAGQGPPYTNRVA
jgi:hypothetical protein